MDDATGWIQSVNFDTQELVLTSTTDNSSSVPSNTTQTSAWTPSDSVTTLQFKQQWLSGPQQTHYGSAQRQASPAAPQTSQFDLGGETLDQTFDLAPTPWAHQSQAFSPHPGPTAYRYGAPAQGHTASTTLLQQSQYVPVNHHPQPVNTDTYYVPLVSVPQAQLHSLSTVDQARREEATIHQKSQLCYNVPDTGGNAQTPASIYSASLPPITASTYISQGQDNSNSAQGLTYQSTSYNLQRSLNIRPTPVSLGWLHSTMTHYLGLYDFIVPKGREPHFELKACYGSSNDTPSKVYFDTSSPAEKGIYPCKWPLGCKTSCKRPADLERHYRNVHADEDQKHKFLCDYQDCGEGRDKRPYNRFDHYRDHLRKYHGEDLGPARQDEDNEGNKGKEIKDQTRQKEKDGKENAKPTPQGETNWWSWWRCTKCLRRIPITDGWVCKHCHLQCKPHRIETRLDLAQDNQQGSQQHGAPFVEHSEEDWQPVYEFRQPGHCPRCRQWYEIDERTWRPAPHSCPGAGGSGDGG